MNSEKESQPINEMVTHLDTIKDLLQKNPVYRDSDSKLVARIWNNEIIKMGKDPKSITAYEMLVMIADERLMKSYVAERLRRKLQNEFPELRGKKWAERKHQEEEVKDRINKEV